MTPAQRRWASRIVLAIAALACAATSRRGWTLEAELPTGAPRTTPVGGSDGLLITVTANHESSVKCDELDARPLDPLPDGAWPATPVRFVCPPGAALGPVYSRGMDGRGGSICSDPSPPPGAVIAATVARIAMWKQEVTLTLDVSLGPATSEHEWRRGLAIHATQDPHLAVALIGHPAGFGDPYVYDQERTADGANASVHVPMFDDHAPAKVEVRATTYGLCPVTSQPCAPPADAVLTVNAR